METPLALKYASLPEFSQWTGARKRRVAARLRAFERVLFEQVRQKTVIVRPDNGGAGCTTRRAEVFALNLLTRCRFGVNCAPL